MDLHIKKLHPGLVDDFLYFFDHLAFTDNPHWASCYCYYYHAVCSDEDWMKRTGAENREAVRQLITDGRMRGFLACVGDRPVGWCHADHRSDLPRLMKMLQPEDPTEKVGAIVCFIIAPEHRRKGIDTRLLQTVCDSFQAEGLGWVEGYPYRSVSTDAHNYHGPLSMYTGNGFQIVEEKEKYLVVRKKLI